MLGSLVPPLRSLREKETDRNGNGRQCVLFPDRRESFRPSHDPPAVCERGVPASCESAMELMVLCLGAYDFDAECGIWKGFFDNADQFNDVFRHKSLNKVKPKNPTERKSLQQALSLQNFLHSPKIYCQKLVLVYRCNLRR